MSTVIPAHGIEVGSRVSDFVMPATKGSPQRLSEQVGHPVMLIWLNDCDGCEEELIDWQYLAEIMADEGLIAWFLWRKEASNKAPWSRLPVLEYNNNKQAWWFESNSNLAVMLINPEGVLDHLFIDDINAQKSEITHILKKWLHNRPWFPLEGQK